MQQTDRYTLKAKPLEQTKVSVQKYKVLDDETLFLDFGKAAFATLLIKSNSQQDSLIIHLGEQLNSNGRIERTPAGSIRYLQIEQCVNMGKATRVKIPVDPRNTGIAAIKMPTDIGEVFPFRYVEIENANGLDITDICQITVHYPFKDDAASFQSSNQVLNDVWDLCKYTIKATSFCGVYVDGDRERIPYEGDAYINQLCHYAVDNDYTIARYTHEYLIQNPTWPTEWQLHSVMMAWADYLYTGDDSSIDLFYDDLRLKTLIDLAREDGLISTESERCTKEFEESLHLHKANYAFSHGLRDLVDWPPGSFALSGQGERDNHEMLPINTVVNAFHCHNLLLMSQIAAVLGKEADSNYLAKQAELVKTSINEYLFDSIKGIYVDGEGSTHASLHSNMMMLAFDLVPKERLGSVVTFVKSRGMACSVYGAQYLLEGLFLNGEDSYGLELLSATHDRSWQHMIDLGSTMTLEAWDLKYKKNLDWNHAWGAVPANIIARFVLGVRPLEAGFRKMLIKPQVGWLEHISGCVPTLLGPVVLDYKASKDSYRLSLKVPKGATATICLKTITTNSSKPKILLNNHDLHFTQIKDGYVSLEGIEGGSYEIIVSSHSM